MCIHHVFQIRANLTSLLQLGKGEQDKDCTLPRAQKSKTSGESDEKNSSKAEGNKPKGTTMETPKAKGKMPY